MAETTGCERQGSVRARVGAAALVSVALSLGACATALPAAPVERALVNDLRTIVRSQVRSEWTVDRIALDAIAPAVAWSACQVAPEARAQSLAWLDAAVRAERVRLDATLPGPGATALDAGPTTTTGELYRRAGRDLDPLEDLVELERMHRALASLEARAAEDCPFWLASDPDFVGMQGDRERFVLLLESRGGAALSIRGTTLGFGGGGAGRVLLGGGLSEGLTLAAGIEIGGAGRFDEDGKVTGVLGGAVPVVLRFVDAGSVIDLELAMTTFLEGARGWPPGVRASVGFGVVTPRVAGAFSPSAVFYVGYELHPARGPDDLFHVIAIGTRIGLDIDP